MSITDLESAVGGEVLLGPAGYTVQGHQDVLIEARRTPLHIGELEDIPVAGPQGPIPLRALAHIVRAPVPAHNAIALDGRG